jgi:hypothetical protein
MAERKHDYLKYWRVIRYFVKQKYGLSQADLDVILFLYSEDYFDQDKFNEFDELLSWDPKRFKQLVTKGWIESFRKKDATYRRALYKLSYKAVRLCVSIYDKLSGEEIPTSNCHNPMFAKNVKYTDKVYRNMIKDMNKEFRTARLDSRNDL